MTQGSRARASFPRKKKDWKRELRQLRADHHKFIVHRILRGATHRRDSARKIQRLNERRRRQSQAIKGRNTGINPRQKQALGEENVFIVIVIIKRRA